MKKGFSLVEILVSVAIIGILSGVGIQTFVVSRQRARLEEDVAKVVRAIRRAQNAALAPSRSTARIGANNKICSIVVRIDRTDNTNTTINLNYTVVVTDPTTRIERCSGDSNRRYEPPVKINYAIVANQGRGFLRFVFNLPDASTSENSIILKLGNLSKTITVTNSGLIKVE